MKLILNKALKIIAMPVFVFLLAYALAPDRFGLHFLSIVLSQTLIPTVMGFGMCLIMISGMFDISCGSAVILGAIIGGGVGLQFGVIGLVVGCLGAGTLIGVITGTIYSLLRIPSLILTLGLALIYEIVAIKLDIGNGTYVAIPPEIAIVGKYPYSIIIAVIAAILFYFIYYKTKFSTNLRSVGSEELLAITVGIKPKRIKFYVFIVAGIFFGITSLLKICYAGTIGAVSGLESIPMIFQPMIGALVAMQLRSVYNLAVGIFISQLSVGLLFAGLIAMGLPDVMKIVMLGIFLLIVMGISGTRTSFVGLMRRIRAKKKQEHEAHDVQ